MGLAQIQGSQALGLRPNSAGNSEHTQMSAHRLFHFQLILLSHVSASHVTILYFLTLWCNGTVCRTPTNVGLVLRQVVMPVVGALCKPRWVCAQKGDRMCSYKLNSRSWDTSVEVKAGRSLRRQLHDPPWRRNSLSTASV